MRAATILTLLFSLTLATPLLPREDCECALCDVGPGDCSGDDLNAYNACVANTLSECGRSCGDLGEGAPQDGCYAAEISRQKPCENACVQKQLTIVYCQKNPGGKGC